jgi:hypothetical protein
VADSVKWPPVGKMRFGEVSIPGINGIFLFNAANLLLYGVNSAFIALPE